MMKTNIPESSKIHVRELMMWSYHKIKENKKKYLVKFDDGVELPMHSSHILLSYPYWGLTRRYSEVQCTSDISYNYRVETNDEQHKDMCNNLVRNGKSVKGIPKEDIWDIVYLIYNDAYNLAVHELFLHASTIDFLDIKELLHDPDIKDAIDNLEDTADSVLITHNIISRVINENRYPRNGIVVAIRNKNVKMSQALQMLVRGRTTEVNSVIWDNPITGGLARFFNKISDYVKEMTSATKSFVYNDGYIAAAEYFSRKMQLLTSAITRLFPGDCGSDELLWLTIPLAKPGEIFISRLVGIEAETLDGKKFTFTGEEKDLVGQRVGLRTTLSCKHLKEQGVCEKCYGEISWNIATIDSPGHVSTVAVCKDATQGILSVKHLDFIMWLFKVSLHKGQDRYFKTKSSPEDASKVFLKEDLDTESVQIRLRVKASSVPHIGNLGYMSGNLDILDIGEVSSISNYWIDVYEREDPDDPENSGEIVSALCDDFSGLYQGVPASLSLEFLNFIKHNPSYVMEERNGYVSFDLTGFNKLGDESISPCIFEYQQRHESMPVYVTNLENILRSDKKTTHKQIIEYNGATEDGCGDAILTVHTYLERKLPGVLISHVATILATLRRKSASDPSIPYGFKDPNVTFAKHDTLMVERDLGAYCIYEKQNDEFCKAKMFLNDERLNSLVDTTVIIPNYREDCK